MDTGDLKAIFCFLYYLLKGSVRKKHMKFLLVATSMYHPTNFSADVLRVNSNDTT